MITSLTKLKRDLRTKVKARVTFSRTGNLISFDNDKNIVSYNHHQQGLYASFQLHKTYYHVIRDHLSEILTFLESYAVLVGAKYIRVSVPFDFTCDLLKEYRMYSRDKELQLLFTHNQSSFDTKILDDSWFNWTIKNHTAVASYLHEMKEKDPTFTFSSLDSLRVLKPGPTSFYLQGYKGLFTIDYNHTNDGIISFRNSKPQSFQTEQELLAILNHEFTSVIKKQRLLNLYEPPRYHFDRFISRYLSGIGKMKSSVYHALHQITNAQRVEEVLSDAQKPKIIGFGSKNIGFFPFDNHIVLINKHRDQVLTFATEQEFYFALRHQLLFLAEYHFADDFVAYDEYLDLLSARLADFETGKLPSSGTTENNLEPIRFGDVRLFKIYDRLVVTSENTAHTFAVHERTKAQVCFCSAVVDVKIKELKLS